MSVGIRADAGLPIRHFRCVTLFVPAATFHSGSIMTFSRLALLSLLLVTAGWAQTTRTWEQTKYDEFEKGTARGVAISSNGTLTLAPSFTALYTSPSTYIWNIASDAQGNVYAAA